MLVLASVGMIGRLALFVILLAVVIVIVVIFFFDRLSVWLLSFYLFNSDIMDVDLLRPGAARPAHSTVLWFEFLLDPSLLENHLQKETPGNATLKFIRNEVRLRLTF
jgi:hypothetical protein